MARLPARLGALLVVLATPTLPCYAAAQQTRVAPDAGCVQHNGGYVCNWSNFKLAFDRARTVAIETGRMERSTAAQLRSLAAALGKTPSEGASADLTLMVLPAEPTGVNVGPADHDLATLRVYAPSRDSSRGVLLWVETLRGQGDRPWPAEVHALITQFQERFPKR